MATIAEQLTSLANTKTAIKNAIVAKGVAVADTDPFSAYAGKIGQISGGGGAPAEEWQPNPNWWDIKKILDEDTRDYAGKVGVILYNFNDVSDFLLTPYTITAVATSDGAFYSYEKDGGNVSHNWDTSKDKDDGRGFKTRWVIYYFLVDAVSNSFTQSQTYFGWGYNHIAYLVLRLNCVYGGSFCKGHRLLEAIDTDGCVISGTDFSYFCQDCTSLRKLPDGLDTSNGTNFNYFCSSCYSLTKLPDGLDMSKGTNFSYFCSYCYTLQKLPDGLNTSSGTNFNNFCQNCYSLQKLSDGLDTSNGTNFSNFCSGCNVLTKLPDALDTSKGTNFSYFCSGCNSLAKLPDGLNTSSGTNFSNFCQNCTSLRKLPDGLDTSSGTNFSYFCSSCSSLQKLPYVLDTSNGTNFNNFCYGCNSLAKLPDGLNTSSGTNFGSFCSYCYSLVKSPEITMSANTTAVTSKYSAPFYSSSWIVEVPLTLPSNTNFWLDSSTRISIESFRYIADHAPDVTATPRTLTVGSTNITRINEADPTIITDLNAKGWTVA